ncbi:MAG TPA: tRNA dihydrouridine synthase DusB [Firmicutes bacterium]|nr:tRNA dihydrouridine synthase DusB [Bacillota bacterium]HBE05815.1 tRNA dihydrouridine synthase DusB [Bacillota bacterium]HBG44058.1 tRNA dihydrouridine synthase DusB [Bacillota bacterium]HCX71330.1 tRNA dihydrouridine synthase DusB [Bacillota bacterium]
MLKIGSVVIDPPVVLAPMAGVTDQAFRLLCKRYGCGLVCTEMVSDQAIIHGNRRTRAMLTINDAERPVSIQLFGSDPDLMGQAAAIVAEYHPDIIDINMGCPAPKIVGNGEGAALLRNPELAVRIAAAVVRAAAKIPVTVKMRTGWDDDSIVAVELARRMQDAGAAAVALHGRTRTQFYSGQADWELIRRTAANLTIPLIGNGDVDSAARALEMFDRTRCAGVMIGQGALGNPWIFRQVAAALAGDNAAAAVPPPLAERFAVITEHLEAQVQQCGEVRGIKEMRKHLAWYFKGLPGAAQHRDLVNRQTTLAGMQQLLCSYFHDLENEPRMHMQI